MINGIRTNIGDLVLRDRLLEAVDIQWDIVTSKASLRRSNVSVSDWNCDDLHLFPLTLTMKRMNLDDLYFLPERQRQMNEQAKGCDL